MLGLAKRIKQRECNQNRTYKDVSNCKENTLQESSLEIRVSFKSPSKMSNQLAYLLKISFSLEDEIHYRFQEQTNSIVYNHLLIVFYVESHCQGDI